MNHEKLVFNPEIRAKEDFVTWAAEALHGQMRTPTVYEFDRFSNELIAEDGSEVSRIFTDALDHTSELVKTHPQMMFEKRRREHELGEYHEMVSMMKSELPNTMVVVSDFPPELMSYPKDVGGYNVSRKQTFLRVIMRQGGRLKMFSQTLDKSDRDGLEAIYEQLGFEAQSGELLGQRMHQELSDEQQTLLMDELTRIYDEVLEQKHGGRFEAGIRMAEEQAAINTYDFVREQGDIIRHAVREVLGNRFDADKQYDAIAVLAHRYQQARLNAPGWTLDQQSRPRAATHPGDIATQQTILDHELEMHGKQARLEGKSFSACGMTLKSDTVMSAEAQLRSDGYGNQEDDSAEAYSFDAYRFCVQCQAPPKEKERPKWCGPCGLCRGCDKKAGGKG